MKSLSALEADVREEIGEELDELIRSPEIRRWLNRGQARLGVYRPLRDILTWDAGDTFVSLPADFHHIEDLVPRGTTRIPSYRLHGAGLWFDEDSSEPAGEVAIFYWANWPAITDQDRCELPELGDDALVSYCLYRFFKRLASSRSDYRAYATIIGQNAVDLSELDALSERHLADYRDAADLLADQHQNPEFFFG